MKCKNQLLLWAIITISHTIITVHCHSQSNSDSSSFLLACGATAEAIDPNGRKWSPDSSFLTTNNSLSSTAKSQDPSLPSTLPYMQSRIFKSQSTYKFPISPKSRHWIRLHFYPSSYDSHDSSTSFFSVTAAGFTLLNNFSASITAQALTQAYIIREFTMIRLKSGLLDLTFTPSTHYPNTFAFINGIEIISMPEIFQPAAMVGFSKPNMDTDVYAMQTMFRLNVGGQSIAASNDHGMSRTWYDDSPHIYGAGFGITSQAESNVAITYPSQKSRFIAPLDVYRTARSMGPNSTLNLNYNLTWILDVDVNFTYLLRLHFCDYRFDKVNQMVFRIFINNQTAETEADIVAWAEGKGVPIYKDYAVYVNDRNGDGQLWLALHPNVEVKPEYYDSILNGLEVYKLNDTTGNLAGPNPLPSPAKKGSSRKGRTFPSRKRKTGLIVGSVLASVALLALIVGLSACHCLKQRANRRTSAGASASAGAWLPIYGSSWSSTSWTKTKSRSSTGTSHISSIGKGLCSCRHFSLRDIRAGTNGFSESCVVGVGGFGKVYKCHVNESTSTNEVAVKRGCPSSQQGVDEFLNEIELLSKLRHRHLVSLIGACEENNEMILVYDYMANGTLREHLYNNSSSNSPTLSWKQRLGICIGAARGIHYLHTGAKHPIIHRDVKSTNILLDHKWVAKVSDFGLSKTRHELDQAHVSTAVKGSFGYLDPEYYRLQQLTDKSDVYSFGVVLFEVLCARPAIDPALPKEQLCLADFAVMSYRKGTIDEMIDPNIKGEISPECLKRYTETAVKCLAENSIDRPSMAEVLRNLENCLQLQINIDGADAVERGKAYAMQEMLLSVEEEENDDDDDDESKQHSVNDAAFANNILEPEGR